MTVMSREEVIVLVTRITQLRQEVSRLGEAQRELRALERQLDAVLGGEQQQPEADAGAASLNDKILNLLDANPERDFAAEGVQRELTEGNINSIRSALARLASMNHIARAGRGKYRSARRTEAKQEAAAEAA
jgi:DNA repair exonuclease SbcCD ATPase subunit